MVRLALRFAREGYAADSERLARILLARAPGHAGLPGVLLASANGLRRQGQADKADALVRELRDRFPQSEEARLAAARG